MKITISLTPEQSKAMEPLRDAVAEAFEADEPGTVVGWAFGLWIGGPISTAKFKFVPHEAGLELIAVLDRYGLRND